MENEWMWKGSCVENVFHQLSAFLYYSITSVKHVFIKVLMMCTEDGMSSVLFTCSPLVYPPPLPCRRIGDGQTGRQYKSREQPHVEWASLLLLLLRPHLFVAVVAQTSAAAIRHRHILNSCIFVLSLAHVLLFIHKACVQGENIRRKGGEKHRKTLPTFFLHTQHVLHNPLKGLTGLKVESKFNNTFSWWPDNTRREERSILENPRHQLEVKKEI